MFNARVALACLDGKRFDSIIEFRGELARAMAPHMRNLPVDMSLWDVEEGLRKRGWLQRKLVADHSGDEFAYLVFNIKLTSAAS